MSQPAHSAQERSATVINGKHKQAKGHTYEWQDVDTSSASVRNRNAAIMKRKEPCRYGIHCSAGGKCEFKHTPEERQWFEKFPKVNFIRFKSERCINPKPHSFKTCLFSHGRENGDHEWCVHCRDDGHLTKACPYKPPAHQS